MPLLRRLARPAQLPKSMRAGLSNKASLHVSPHSTDDWEEDVLGKDTLPDGESVKITFEDRDKHVHWDLKVTDKEGNSLEWYDLNLIEISEVTLHWKDGKGWADIK